MSTRDAMNEAIAGLPDELRIPLVLRYQEGMSQTEVAEACRCSAATVARRLGLARDRLRKKLAGAMGLAGGSALEEAIGQADLVPVPAGLKERLLDGVSRGLEASARLGGGHAAALPAKALTVIALSIALSSLAWLGLTRAMRSGVDRAPAVAAALPSPARQAPRDARGPARAPVQPAHAPEQAPRASAPDAPPAAEASAAPAGAPEAAPAAPVLYGWVQDSRGAPVAGAKVFVLPAGGAKATASTETDAAGYYELSSLEQRAVEAMADYKKLVTGLTALQGGLDVEFQAKAAEKDAASALYAHKLAEANLVRAQRDTARRAQVLYEDAFVEQTRLAAAKSEVDLAEAMKLSALQVWAQNGESLSVTTGGFGSSVEWDAITGAVSKKKASQHVVAAIAEGFEVARSDPFDAPAEGEALEVDLTLVAGRPITGVVVSAAGGPVPDADVRVAAHGLPSSLPEAAAVARSDAQGAFRLPALPDGVFVLSASAPGFAPAEVLTARGESTAIRLEPTGSLAVDVARKETGDALVSYEVEVIADGDIIAAHAATDASGKVVFAELRPGNYRINTYRQDSDSKFSRAMAEVAVEARAEVRVRLEVAHRVPIRGHVAALGADALPAGMTVEAVRRGEIARDERPSKVVPVDDEGRFQFSDLPVGIYDLTALAKDGAVVAAGKADVPEGGLASEVALEGASAQVRQAKSPCANDASRDVLSEALSGAPPLIVEAPVTLRSFLDLLAASRGIGYRVEGGAAAGGFLDLVRLDGKRSLGAAEIAAEFARARLPWSATPAGVVLAAPAAESGAVAPRKAKKR